MTVKKSPGKKNARRFMTYVSYDVDKRRPLKGLTSALPKTGGRGNKGRISTRHIGGRHKRLYREIDFKRDKFNVPAKVVSIEYDPNRSAYIAQLNYVDGEKRYILAPNELKKGDTLVSGDKVEVAVGNTMPLEKIPVGTIVHNIELTPGKGGQIARSAGTNATLMSRDSGFAHLKMPSGEIRKIPIKSKATMGVVSKADLKNITLGKAGRSRHMGIRPTVRGLAMSPADHPHGGGEGKSGIGMSSPKSPWGKRTLGKKTRKKNKFSNKYIVQVRKRK
ncbi:50S ribosomal protein L2 [Patescibacteria group bacterium]|nr:50S ribosomal protein L2 [Patescibacteria group bacterium]